MATHVHTTGMVEKGGAPSPSATEREGEGGEHDDESLSKVCQDCITL
jgi:hypothetical protein